MKNILITGVGGPAGINISKLFQKYKNEVNIFGVDSDNLSAGKIFVKEFELISKVSDFDNYKKDLENLVKKWEIDLVIPTVQDELIYVEKALGNTVKILVSNEFSLNMCHDKLNTYLAFLRNFPDLMVDFQLANSLPYFERENYFIKPRIGRGARGCKKVSKKELKFLIDEKEIDEKMIIMDLIQGREYTIDAYVKKDGFIKYLVPRERILLSGGISAKGKVVKHEKIEKKVEEIIRKFSFYGPICIQMMEIGNGDLKIIEINPRFSGGLTISALSGIDIPKVILEEFDENINLFDNRLEFNEITVVRYLEDVVL